jgi:6-phosphofructokinase 2
MTHIITVAINPSLDKSTEIENLAPEQKLRCKAPNWQAGGGGINVARVVQRLGGSPVAIFTAGGPAGTMLRDLLDEEGVTQEVIPISGLTRTSLAVRETSSNQQYRFSVPGPQLSKQEWQSCFQALRDKRPKPAYLVLSGGLAPGVPDDFYGSIASWAREQQIRVILDTHHKPLRHAVNKGVYLIKPNLRELRQLTGRKLDYERSQREALHNLIDQGGAEYIVLSLGAGGAFFASAQGITHLRAPTVKIRSKVGAGDSMVGGIVWALANQYEPFAAAQFGVAAGAAAVMSEGSKLCRRDDVLDLYERIEE